MLITVLSLAGLDRRAVRPVTKKNAVSIAVFTCEVRRARIVFDSKATLSSSSATVGSLSHPAGCSQTVET